MKLCILIIILSIYSHKIHSQVAQSSKLEDFRLSGKIKEITSKSFLAREVDGDLLKGKLSPTKLGSHSISIIEFDTNGLLQKVSYYWSDESLDAFRTLSFDENNRLLKYTIHKDTAIYNIWNYSYPDSSTVLIDIISPSDEKEPAKYTYSLYPDGEIKRIRREYYRSDTLDLWHEQFFSHYSNMISIHGKSMDGNASSYLIILDDNGNEIETVQISDFISYRITRKFDENLMLQEEKTVRNGETNVENYIYQLDTYGNWISKWTVKNGEPKFITTREIIYY